MEVWNGVKRRELRSTILFRREELKKACSASISASWSLISHLENQLNQALAIEERYWKQRSRIDWLRYGDCNTRFFHLRASARRIPNNIGGLFNEDGMWVIEKIGLEEIISNYFKKVFTSGVPSQPEIV